MNETKGIARDYWTGTIAPSLRANAGFLISNPLVYALWHRIRPKRYKTTREAFNMGLSIALWRTLGYMEGRAAMRREAEAKQGKSERMRIVEDLRRQRQPRRANPTELTH